MKVVHPLSVTGESRCFGVRLPRELIRLSRTRPSELERLRSEWVRAFSTRRPIG